MYRVYENGGARKAAEVDALRAASSRYGLWIDLDKGVIRERSRGDLPLAGKRMLGRLLLHLVTNAGRAFPPEELFEAVWEREVFGLSELTVVRTSISRLRRLVEPTPPVWQYIRKTPTSFWSPVGAYYFAAESSYCPGRPHGLLAPFPLLRWPLRPRPGRGAGSVGAAVPNPGEAVLAGPLDSPVSGHHRARSGGAMICFQNGRANRDSPPPAASRRKPAGGGRGGCRQGRHHSSETSIVAPPRQARWRRFEPPGGQNRVALAVLVSRCPARCRRRARNGSGHRPR